MKKILFGVMIIMALIGASCDVGLGPAEGGVITLQIGDYTSARTLLPNIDMDVAVFDIFGTEDDGTGTFQFLDTVNGSSVTASGLTVGDWTILVQGKNAADEIIGEGTTNVTVLSAQSVSANIDVTQLTGVGTLDVTVNWTPAANIAMLTPGITSTLTPMLGTFTSLPFIMDLANNTGNYNGPHAAGYYTLIVKLTDGANTVAGRVEVARLAEGGTTTGVYNFDEINGMSPGDILISIGDLLGDPIDITLTATDDDDGTITQAPETQVTVTATAPAEDPALNIIYVWYLNAEVIDSGVDFVTIAGNDYPKGNYNLDVIGYTADGQRAGSQTYAFKIKKS